MNKDGSDGKESTCNVGDPGLISGPGRSSGEQNGNPHQYSCLENTQRIPWTEDPPGIPFLQSKGSQRVRHDWVTNTFSFKENNICLDIQPTAIKRAVLP